MSESAQTQSEDPVAEWHYLSDRAQQIYGGLVGLSDFGHWDSYFARTFDIYTRVRTLETLKQARKLQMLLSSGLTQILCRFISFGASNSSIGSSCLIAWRHY
jgi:hypothetical protein